MHLHFLFSLILDARSQPEIGNLDAHAFIQQHVAQFEIAVHYALVVDVARATHELHQKEAHFRFGEHLALFEHVY